MDPLGRPGWKGEWISVRALRRFAWSHGGALSVAVTPTAKAAPYEDVTIEDSRISMTSKTLAASWGITTPRQWSFPGADVLATFEPADDPLIAAAGSAPMTQAAAATDDAPAKPVAAVNGTSLLATSALPPASGAYRATLTLTDRRFGDVVAQTEDVAVFVPGPRRATLRLHMSDETIETGKVISLSLSVANTGTESWADPVELVGPEAAMLPVRATRVVAHWIPLDEAADTALPAPVEIQAVPLSPGSLVAVRAKLVAPALPGAWALVVDIVDGVDGSFAALGSAPAVQVFELVVSPHGAALE